MSIADPLSRVYLKEEGEPDEGIAEIEAINLVEHLPMTIKRWMTTRKRQHGTLNKFNWEQSSWSDGLSTMVMFLKWCNLISTTGMN